MQELTAWDLGHVLRGHSYRHANEAELERGVEEVLTGRGLTARRQVHLGKSGRIDMMVDLPRADGPPVRLGIELKVAGQASAVRRQLAGYAEHDQVDELLLVTTVYRHGRELAPLGRQIGGKPLVVALVNRGLL